MTKGDKIVEFFQKGTMVQYLSQTSGGMSGGSIEFENKIVGDFAISCSFLI